MTDKGELVLYRGAFSSLRSLPWVAAECKDDSSFLFSIEIPVKLFILFNMHLNIQYMNNFNLTDVCIGFHNTLRHLLASHLMTKNFMNIFRWNLVVEDFIIIKNLRIVFCLNFLVFSCTFNSSSVFLFPSFYISFLPAYLLCPFYKPNSKFYIRDFSVRDIFIFRYQ